METTLVKIGNSQGLIIPKKLLVNLGDVKHFDMEIINGTLMIKPLTNNPRENWEEQFSNASKEGIFPDKLESDFGNEFDNTEWTW